jgi:hypothetical protein
MSSSDSDYFSDEDINEEELFKGLSKCEQMSPEDIRPQYEILSVIDEKTKIIKIDFIGFINNTTNWTYNRKINEEKVEEILTKLEENKNFHSLFGGWTFHAIQTGETCDKFKLLDGQHRREAIKRYLLKNYLNINHNNDVIMWIYTFENDEQEEVIELFKNINSNTNIDDIYLPSTRKIKLLKLIKENDNLKNGIKYDERCNTSYPPHIHIKELKNIIDIIIKNYGKNYTDEQIINRLVDINTKIWDLTNEEFKLKSLFGRKIINDKRMRLLNKCHSIRFYLNIKESKYNYNEWIKYFNEPQNIK